MLHWFYLPVQLDYLRFSDSLKNVEASLAYVDASFFLGKVCFLVTGGMYGICPLPPLRAAQLTVAFLKTRQWLNLKQTKENQQLCWKLWLNCIWTHLPFFIVFLEETRTFFHAFLLSCSLAVSLSFLPVTRLVSVPNPWIWFVLLIFIFFLWQCPSLFYLLLQLWLNNNLNEQWGAYDTVVIKQI